MTLKTLPLLIVLADLLVPTLMAAQPAVPPVNPAAYKAPVRVACIGDSITEGIGADQGKSYPAQLQNLLGNSWQVTNFGASGHTLLKKGDAPYWNHPKYQDALAFKPDVVIIMLGTNDTKPQNWQHHTEFAADYKTFVKSFQDLASKPRIWICRPCPVPDPGNFGISGANVKALIPRINALATQLHLGVIDMHAALTDHPQFLPDRVHPNTDGAAALASAAFTALTGKPAPAPAAK
jgi:lysophospholipase L1-like esterase